MQTQQFIYSSDKSKTLYGQQFFLNDYHKNDWLKNESDIII